MILSTGLRCPRPLFYCYTFIGSLNQPHITGSSECYNLLINEGSTLTIDAGANFTVVGNLINKGSLVIESSPYSSVDPVGLKSNGSLIVKGSSTGVVTYNRYLRPDNVYGDRHFFSSPVGGQGVQAFITANPGKINLGGTGYEIREWNEPSLTANWQIVSPAVSFGSGRGYRVNQADGSNGLLKFTGTVVNSATVRATSPYANYNGNPRSTRADYGDPALHFRSINLGTGQELE